MTGDQKMGGRNEDIKTHKDIPPNPPCVGHISQVSFGTASGISLALIFAVLTLLGMLRNIPSIGILEVYPGYQVGGLGIVMGIIWGFITGFLFGILGAWLCNKLVGEKPGKNLVEWLETYYQRRENG